MTSNKKDRETLTNSLRVSRFFILPIVFGLAYSLMSDIIATPATRLKTFIVLFFFLALYRLIYHIRQIQYDTDTLYLVYGRKEKNIPFPNIISIHPKPSNFFNARRWQLKYKNEHYKTHTCLYTTYGNQNTAEAFHQAVQNKNEDVLIDFPSNSPSCAKHP